MYVVGLDLGQARDYSALCILERSDVLDTTATPPRTVMHVAVRHLHRWALATPYPTIVAEVMALLGTAPLDRVGVPLVIDLTGVGRAVGDLFTVGAVRPYGVTITGGLEPNTEDRHNLKVPKRDVISTLTALFQTQHLKIADGLELAPVLLRELATMRVKINLQTGNDSYEHWRSSDHDDIALAVGIAAWYAEAFPARPYSGAVGGKRPSPHQLRPGEPPEFRALRGMPGRGFRPLG